MRVLVTGATRGMGLEICRTISTQCDLLLCTSKSEDNSSKLKTEISAECDVEYFPQDLRDGKSAAKNIGDWARAKTDKLDALILNAGFYTEGNLAEFPEKEMRESLEANFLVNLFLVQEFLDLIKASERRRIVIIGSTAAYEPYPLVPSYGIAKWALRGLALNLRAELAKDRIGVTFVSPGATWTSMWEGEELPRNRLLEPSDIANAVQYVLGTSEQAVVEELVVRSMDGDIHE